METHELHSTVRVIKASICEIPGSRTADKGVDSYLLTKFMGATHGTQRHLCHAFTAEGDHVIYMATNGYDEPLTDDFDEMCNLLSTMGDAPDSHDDRIRTGIVRVLDAFDQLSWRYNDQEEFLNYRLWAGAIIADVAMDLGSDDCGHTNVDWTPHHTDLEKDYL